MFKAARNDYRVYSFNRSRGIALLVMLAMILVAFTTIAISRLSQNSAEQKARAKTTQALIQSRDAIMAYAVARDAVAVPLQPPGTLPCPDTDGDGLSNPVGTGTCTNRRGLVPFVTLGITQPFDGASAPIWYVVPSEYSGNPSNPHNSNRNSTLLLNGQAIAFLLLAPNSPVAGQNWPALQPYRNPLATTYAQFLEGLNAGANPTNYSDIYIAAQNDQVLSVSLDYFWTNVEGRVLRELSSLLNAYRANCGIYPWPAPYSSFNSNNSDPATPPAIKTYEGRVPLQNVLPSAWGMACPAPATVSAPAAPPNWIFNHWGNMIYYAICRSPIATPTNPPATSCLQLGNGKVAEAILIGPGIELGSAGQNRVASQLIGNYFEGQNASTVDNMFNQIKSNSHTALANDHIYVIR